MAVADFVPLIGSGFDSLANQRLQWETFNRGVEEANLARASQAEDRQNNWLAQVAQMNQQREDQNIARQLSADQTARAMAASEADRRERADQFQQQFKESQKEFADTQKQKETQFAKSLEYGREQIAQAKKIKEFSVDQRGAALAQHYAIAHNDSEKAQFDLQEAQSKIEGLRAKVDADLNLPAKKQNITQRLLWQNQIKELERNIPGLQKLARIAENTLLTLPMKRDYQDFDIGEDGQITHPDTSSTWSWKKALKQAQQQQQQTQGTGTTMQPVNLNPVPLSGPPAETPDATPDTGTGAPPWAGFAPRVWDAQSQPMIEPQMSAVPRNPFSEGQVIRNKRTGQLARVVNGVPVSLGGSNDGLGSE